MLSLSLGPFVLAPYRLVFFLAIAVTFFVGWLYGRRTHVVVEPVITRMLFLGLLIARIAFVVIHFDDYRSDPLGIIDIRDGGFAVLAGLAMALLIAAHQLWRRPEMGRTLAVAVVSGAIVWGGGFALAGALSAKPNLADLPPVAQDGHEHALGRLGNKPMVVNLWATWCGPCRREMPVFAAAQQRETGVEFVFINQGESVASVQGFFEQEQLHLRNVFFDRSSEWSQYLGAQGLPTTLFFDAKGNLVGSHIGELSAATLKQGLKKL